MLADPDYVAAKVRASGAFDQQVDVVGPAQGAFTVTTRRSLPTDHLPARARGIVGARLDVRHVEAWEAPADDGSRVGTVVVEIVGAPVRLTGTTRLAAAGPGPADATSRSRLTYQGELRATVPLFGSVVEDAAAQAVRTALGAEEAVAIRWVADHPTTSPG